jgi:hypothetical protein
MQQNDIHSLKKILVEGDSRYDYRGFPEMFLYKKMPVEFMGDGPLLVLDVRIPLLNGVDSSGEQSFFCHCKLDFTLCHICYEYFSRTFHI